MHALTCTYMHTQILAFTRIRARARALDTPLKLAMPCRCSFQHSHMQALATAHPVALQRIQGQPRAATRLQPPLCAQGPWPQGSLQAERQRGWCPLDAQATILRVSQGISSPAWGAVSWLSSGQRLPRLTEPVSQGFFLASALREHPLMALLVKEICANPVPWACGSSCIVLVCALRQVSTQLLMLLFALMPHACECTTALCLDNTYLVAGGQSIEVAVEG